MVHSVKLLNFYFFFLVLALVFLLVLVLSSQKYGLKGYQTAYFMRKKMKIMGGSFSRIEKPEQKAQCSSSLGIVLF